ncbi:hypothetical protein psal_cds_747 [Pandoravirus salinus]|uniref:Uncharacterized protein n=1 Tax=Pandoravirus salinus TaxID=1349410 RepID=S4W2J5_9VIRU|nr:hypothetical protein psal_cds_747 [Pandoravirus salinus]AGO84732.1 hypothetical protein psal_cds_747 [Pandoravirus salinus]
MGKEGRVWGTFGIWAAGIALAPFTGGASVVAAGIYGGVRMVAEANIDERPAYKNIERAAEARRSERVTQLEIRYCHISNDDDSDALGSAADAGITLAARALAMSTQAAHHHFVILVLESGTLIYVDKHSHRNVLVRDDKRGKNGGGDKWLSSELLKSCSPTRWNGNVNLGDVIDFVSRDQFETYHLIDANCQHFAEALYQWI